MKACSFSTAQETLYICIYIYIYAYIHIYQKYINTPCVVNIYIYYISFTYPTFAPRRSSVRARAARTCSCRDKSEPLYIYIYVYIFVGLYTLRLWVTGLLPYMLYIQYYIFSLPSISLIAVCQPIHTGRSSKKGLRIKHSSWNRYTLAEWRECWKEIRFPHGK